MRFISNRRIVATVAAATCLAAPMSASAAMYEGNAAKADGKAYSPPSTSKSDAAQSGGKAYSPPATSKSDAAQTGAPTAAPTTIEVVRPERTIVREVDEVLPLALSGTALLVVLAGFGFMVVRSGSVPRLGRSH